MNTEDIIKFENNAGNELHLFRDRLFWQAWERSAFLFSKIFRKYQVHHRFVQKVAQDLVWLGFGWTYFKIKLIEKRLAEGDCSMKDLGKELQRMASDVSFIRGLLEGKKESCE